MQLRDTSIAQAAAFVRLETMITRHMKENGTAHTTRAATHDPHTRKQRIGNMAAAMTEMLRAMSEEITDLHAANDMTAKDNLLGMVEAMRHRMSELAQDIHIRMTDVERTTAALKAASDEPAPDTTT